jgi:PII-like signaling protein
MNVMCILPLFADLSHYAGKMKSRTLSSLRIYITRREITPRGGRRRPLVTAIVDAARTDEIEYASAMFGQEGFVLGDGSGRHLPVCIELVAAPAALERFVAEHGELLAGATLMLTEGTRLFTEVDALVEAI